VFDKDNMQKKHEKACAALVALQEALASLKAAKNLAESLQKDPEKLRKIFRDSLIYRFKYTFDLTWKYLADYLGSEGRLIEVKAPKAIFREAFKVGLLSEEEVSTAIGMVDHRNLTTHGYNEKLIEEISSHIPNYVLLFERVLQCTPQKK
jgi:nucleotidyltransferase substrate binding protein (TIGR01987 family)